MVDLACNQALIIACCTKRFPKPLPFVKMPRKPKVYISLIRLQILVDLWNLQSDAPIFSPYVLQIPLDWNLSLLRSQMRIFIVVPLSERRSPAVVVGRRRRRYYRRHWSSTDALFQLWFHCASVQSIPKKCEKQAQTILGVVREKWKSLENCFFLSRSSHGYTADRRIGSMET